MIRELVNRDISLPYYRNPRFRFLNLLITRDYPSLRLVELAEENSNV